MVPHLGKSIFFHGKKNNSKTFLFKQTYKLWPRMQSHVFFWDKLLKVFCLPLTAWALWEHLSSSRFWQRGLSGTVQKLTNHVSFAEDYKALGRAISLESSFIFLFCIILLLCPPVEFMFVWASFLLCVMGNCRTGPQWSFPLRIYTLVWSPHVERELCPVTCF